MRSAGRGPLLHRFMHSIRYIRNQTACLATFGYLICVLDAEWSKMSAEIASSGPGTAVTPSAPSAPSAVPPRNAGATFDGAQSAAARQEAKARKKAAIEGGTWDRCMMFLPLKKRYCNIPRLPGTDFCGNHQSALPADAQYVGKNPAKKAKAAGGERAVRVPCPVDPSHEIYEHDLPRHVRKCVAAKKQKHIEALPCYRKGCNGGCLAAEEAAAVASFRAAVGMPAHGLSAPGQGLYAWTRQQKQKAEPRLQAAAAAATDGDAGASAPVQSRKRPRPTEDDSTAPSVWMPDDEEEVEEAEEEAEGAEADTGSVGGSSSRAEGGRRGGSQQPLGYIDKLATGATSIDLRSLLLKIDGWAKLLPALPPPRTLCMPEATLIVAEAAALGAGVVSKASLLRHEKQQVSIVSHMAEAGLLNAGSNNSSSSSSSPVHPPLFVEFGAGRGMLSLTLSRVLPAPHIVLIDRAPVKNKADTALRRGVVGPMPGLLGVTATAPAEAHKSLSARFTRVRMDIADCWLPGLPQLWGAPPDDAATTSTSTPAEQSAGPSSGASAAAEAAAATTASAGGLLPIVAIGKHLCGGATDLTLRCLAKSLTAGSGVDIDALAGDVAAAAPAPAAPAATAAAAQPYLHGIAIATCCHHVCTWEAYVGKSWWRDVLGGSACEFEAMRSLTSWAIIGEQEEETEVQGGGAGGEAGIGIAAALPAEGDPRTGLTRALRMRIGRLCKRLMDAGRAAFLTAAFRTYHPVTAPAQYAAGINPPSSGGTSGDSGSGSASDANELRLDVQLRHYCEANLSPENCLLLAVAAPARARGAGGGGGATSFTA